VRKSEREQESERERERKRETERQREMDRETDRRTRAAASLALLFAFERLHQVVLQSLLLRLVSQSLDTPLNLVDEDLALGQDLRQLLLELPVLLVIRQRVNRS